MFNIFLFEFLAVLFQTTELDMFLVEPQKDQNMQLHIIGSRRPKNKENFFSL